MSDASGLSIGIDSEILRGNMTGIANYSYHLLTAILGQDPSLHYSGFSNLFWRPVNLQTFQREFYAKSNDSNSSWSKAKVKAAIRTRIAQIEAVRIARREIRTHRFSHTVGRQSIDLFHALNFTPLSDPGVPTLPTVYDLSFVRYPEVHPRQRLRQLARLSSVISKASIIHTISAFSQKEIAAVYGVSMDKIIVAPPAASYIFRQTDAVTTAEDVQRFDLSPDRYFLTVGTLEPRKNLRTLISAYARLSPACRQNAVLVVVGGAGWGALDLPPETPSLIADRTLRFLGSISDAELRSLYQAAIALLFPSIYEGFGMPVVEALACGTAVAHSSDTAMDEISGPYSIRIPAMDVVGWSHAMKELIEQAGSCADLRAARVAQARQFSWETSAVTVRQAYFDIEQGCVRHSTRPAPTIYR